MLCTAAQRHAVEFMMSGQKYLRTNFDDDDDQLVDSSAGAAASGVSPTDGTGGGLDGAGRPSPHVSVYTTTVAFGGVDSGPAVFWRRRTCLERFLLVLSGCLVVVVVVLLALIFSHDAGVPSAPHDSQTQPPPPSTGLCTTKTCVTAASAILNAMDDTVKPCDDFYQFACGGWIKSHPIPSSKSRWNTFAVLRKQNEVVIKNVLELPVNESLSEAEAKAKNYYISCLDANQTVEALGAQPLLDLIHDKFPGWTVNWDLGVWDFRGTLEKIHALGMSSFFSSWVAEDEKEPTKNILQFDQGGLILQKDQYANKTENDRKILSAYLKYMTDISVLLGGASSNRSLISQRMQEVIEFEQAIAEITVAQENRRDDEKLYHKMSLQELQTLAPFINWLHYINSMLSVTEYQVVASEPVLVFQVDYMGKITTLINETQHQPSGNRTLHNYMLWHLVTSLSSLLSKPFRDIRKEFMKALTGVTGEDEKWRYCVEDTNGALSFAVGAMYVRETFHGDSKASAEEMIRRVKKAFVDNLPNLEWMDNKTRVAAVAKAEAVVDMIGFPEFILNASKLDERYEELSVNENEYFYNNMRLFSYTLKRNMDKLRKPPDKYSWSMSPPTVNAYYSPTKNEIVFPAGILQAPFYDRSYPKSLNYGAMGVVMGHELTHGFDDQGREYDKDGVLKSWWEADVITRFNETAQCFVKQYSKYTSNGEHLKGRQTLGENIADNGGLKSAYHAFRQWAQQYGDEPLLPGLHYSHKQLFFIAFAQVWCSNSRPESTHLSILGDPHSLAKFRVIGTISNSREFSQEFSCPSTCAMNPPDKCNIW